MADSLSNCKDPGGKLVYGVHGIGKKAAKNFLKSQWSLSRVALIMFPLKVGLMMQKKALS